MADDFRPDSGSHGLVKQYKEISPGVFAEVMALEPASIGGVGAAQTVTIADPVTPAQKALVTAGGRLQVELPPGGGGAVTIADGADVAEGTTTDISGANTVIGKLKAIAASLAGTIAVSIQNATLAVTQSGVWTVARSWTLSSATDSVNVGNFPGTQPISGTVDTELTTSDVDTGVGVDTRAVVGIVRAESGGGTLVGSANPMPVSGSFFQATQPVSIATMPSTPVTGTFWQATQPVSLATNTPDVTDRVARLLGHVTVDNASIAVTGTFWQATQPVSAASLPLPTGASTETSLTGMSAKLPATLGQKTMAASLAVAIASDQSAVPTKETAAILVGTALSAANTTVTLTLPAPGAGLFHYITSIEIVAFNPTVTAIAAAATTLAFTTTNLNGMVWNAGTLLAAGAEKVVTRMFLGPPIRSAVAATATTIVAPAVGTGGLVRIQVTYYTST